LQSEGQMFIVSFCTESVSKYVILATNLREFYIEKIDDDVIMDRVNVRVNAVLMIRYYLYRHLSFVGIRKQY
jgi:hypothetical protein